MVCVLALRLEARFDRVGVRLGEPADDGAAQAGRRGRALGTSLPTDASTNGSTDLSRDLQLVAFCFSVDLRSLQAVSAENSLLPRFRADF
jgi:hypothetical protein